MLDALRTRAARGAPRPERCLLATLAGVFLILATTSLPALCTIAVTLLARTMASRRSRERLPRRLLSLAFVLVPAVALRVGCTPGAASMQLLGGAVSREALRAGATMALRVGGAGLLTSWFSDVVSAAEVEAALRRLGVPLAFVELLALTRRFAAQLGATLVSAWTALLLRGGASSARAMGRSSGLLAGLLVVRALDRSGRVAIALALRGHGGEGVARRDP